MCQVLRGITDGYETIMDTDKKAQLMMLRSSSEALKDRMENIIQWVKQELANSVVTPKQFNVNELVEECIKTQSTAIVVKSLIVSNEVPTGLTAYDDASVVSLVIQNLLGNAVKYSYPAGEITIKSETKGDRIWIAVADNGMGISEKKLEKIFNFMTSSAQGTSGETGTGIGLFVSKQFVDKIGGEITIESGKDSGTTVKFSINSKK
jgi:signal transduction histidine kinase